jgi:pimeloyl-ACP methyl ester carboxylesterase
MMSRNRLSSTRDRDRGRAGPFGARFGRAQPGTQPADVTAPAARCSGPDRPLRYLRVPVSDGRSLHVTVFGPADGLPTVALHGLGGSTEANLPALRAAAERYRLRTYAIDLPNHGRSGTVGLFDFRVRHFSDLILEAIRALKIETSVIVGHSFGGQLAALVAEELATDSLQPIFINPALGKPWDSKLDLCWRRPWRFLKLIEELGYNDGNVARGELYHAGRLLRSIMDMFLDRHLRPYRRLQATMALLLNRDTASTLGRLMQRDIAPIIVHGELDRSVPANADVHYVSGFHDWLEQANGPQALVTALAKVFPGPLQAETP